jgi:hypothetical protein
MNLKKTRERRKEQMENKVARPKQIIRNKL